MEAAAGTWAEDAAQQPETRHDPSLGASLTQLLQQQQQHAGLPDEQLAVLAAGTDGQHAPLGTGPGTSAPTDVTLPPVPHLQGTSLAYLNVAGAQEAGDATGEQLQMFGQQQLQMQIAALTGGLADPQQLSGNKRKAGGCGTARNTARGTAHVGCASAS
jgi:hypothetical protein